MHLLHLSGVLPDGDGRAASAGRRLTAVPHFRRPGRRCASALLQDPRKSGDTASRTEVHGDHRGVMGWLGINYERRQGVASGPLSVPGQD